MIEVVNISVCGTPQRCARHVLRLVWRSCVRTASPLAALAARRRVLARPAALFLLEHRRRLRKVAPQHCSPLQQRYTLVRLGPSAWSLQKSSLCTLRSKSCSRLHGSRVPPSAQLPRRMPAAVATWNTLRRVGVRAGLQRVKDPKPFTLLLALQAPATMVPWMSDTVSPSP